MIDVNSMCACSTGFCYFQCMYALFLTGSPIAPILSFDSPILSNLYQRSWMHCKCCIAQFTQIMCNSNKYNSNNMYFLNLLYRNQVRCGNPLSTWLPHRTWFRYNKFKFIIMRLRKSSVINSICILLLILTVWISYDKNRFTAETSHIWGPRKRPFQSEHSLFTLLKAAHKISEPWKLQQARYVKLRQLNLQIWQ